MQDQTLSTFTSLLFAMEGKALHAAQKAYSKQGTTQPLARTVTSAVAQGAVPLSIADLVPTRAEYITQSLGPWVSLLARSSAKGICSPGKSAPRSCAEAHSRSGCRRYHYLLRLSLCWVADKCCDVDVGVQSVSKSRHMYHSRHVFFDMCIQCMVYRVDILGQHRLCCVTLLRKLRVCYS